MAEIIASEILKAVFSKLASEAMEKYVRSKGIGSELENLERTLKHIQALLSDASHKETNENAVKLWLNSLQHLAYDIDDILDGLATEAMHREFSGSVTSKVRKLVPTCCTNLTLDMRMRDKLNIITTKLQNLEKEKTTLGLIVKDERPKNINRISETSLVDVSGIVGRQGEKEALIQELLEGEPSAENFSVVPIVGIGGIGKTTLARLLYNEKLVQDHFELRAWVCVSDDFDSFAISKVIYQSIGGENREFADLNLLQVELREKLRGKCFLLVLDDVWSESYEHWDSLVVPFHACAPGSKIIMTTRKEILLKMLGFNHLSPLQKLSRDDAVCLFSKHALGVSNFDSHQTLKQHGEGIVEKCDGLPLALKALGRLLRSKTDEDYWKYVLNSEIWRLQDGGGIVPALRLSYNELSAQLKQLFAYCSLFPKDYMFDKEKLILLWMAEGFLQQSSENNLTDEERLGQECFEELLSRSFFQHAPNDDLLFVMHDLMNDLATYVAGDFCIRLDQERKNDIGITMLQKYRHMSFVREEYITYKKFEVFKGAGSLRTFLVAPRKVEELRETFHLSNKILVDLLPKLPLLRVLCLSGYEISEVPESIGGLKHLRYLNLSQTRITNLPENVGKLYNLQTLILFGCHDLIKLPNSFIKLKNLRHFDLRDTPSLNKMPLGLGELKSLQTLSKIIIRDDNRFEITDLKGLKYLCGKISIKGLDKVKDVVHVREVNFSQKRLSELEVEWNDVPEGSRKEMFEKDVLNELKPHNDSLKQLKIVSYSGTMLPNWVGDPSFHHLKHVSILGCKKCISLPPLGQLDSLKELFIEGLDGVKSVGSELLGSGVAFRSLEILRIKDMQGWEEWSTNGGVVFPYLKDLYITDCPKLDVISVEALPSLRVLYISECGNDVLRSLVQVASSVTKLDIEYISGLTHEVWGSVIQYLGGVGELCITKCNEIRYLWESETKASTVLKNLRILKVLGCDNLVSLACEKEDNEESKMTSLRMLEIWFCKSIGSCSCPNNIERLRIWNCDSITDISFPTGGGQNLKSLWIAGCKNLLEKEFGGGANSSGNVLINNTSTTMLEQVTISGWVNLKSIIELGCYVHLIRLRIQVCDNLESFPDHHLSNLTSLKHLAIVCCKSMDASFPSSGMVWPPKLQLLEIGGLKKPMSEWGGFPTSLVHLILDGSEEKDVIDLSNLCHLFPLSLTSLEIWHFNKLEKVSMGLQHLTSLQHLKIWYCPNVTDLPEMLLPSLLSLRIIGCSKLKERCRRRGSNYYWPRISHIPEIECRKLKKRCRRGSSYYNYWPFISHIPKIELKDMYNLKEF